MFRSGSCSPCGSATVRRATAGAFEGDTGLISQMARLATIPTITAISAAMRDYAGPLIVGELPIRIGTDGLPVFTRMQRKPIERKLPPFVGKKM